MRTSEATTNAPNTTANVKVDAAVIRSRGYRPSSGTWRSAISLRPSLSTMSETPGGHTVGMPSSEIVQSQSGVPRASGDTTAAYPSATLDHRSHRDDQEGRRPASWASWHPLAGPALLDRLRATGRARPSGDPTLAAELRAFLEEGLAPGAGGSARTGPLPGPVGTGLVVTKDRITRALACEEHRRVPGVREVVPSLALARGALVDVLFRQLVTIGRIGDVLSDGLDALSVDDHQALLVDWIVRLPSSARSELRAEVDRQIEGLRRRWPVLDPAWLPRTQESLRVPLATCTLSARVDLAIGRPGEPTASVAILEVKSGTRRPQHRADLHFYALLETLRSRVSPFVVATHYAATGELDVDPVDAQLLATAARRCLAGVRAMTGAPSGPDPAGGPAVGCGSCAALPVRDRHRLRHPAEVPDKGVREGSVREGNVREGSACERSAHTDGAPRDGGPTAVAERAA